MKTPKETNQEAARLPLWKSALETLRLDGIGYNTTIQASRLEDLLRCKRDTAEFAFAMIEIRKSIEAEDGFYLAEINGGAAYEIPDAAAHGDVAKSFDKSVRRYAVRAVNLRMATLMNPSADLSPEKRSAMERDLEHSATRLVMLSRQRSVVKALGADSKLLKR